MHTLRKKHKISKDIESIVLTADNLLLNKVLFLINTVNLIISNEIVFTAVVVVVAVKQ